MITILSVIYFLGFLICLCLIGFVLYKNPRSILNLVCALLILSFAIWSLGDLSVNIYRRSQPPAIPYMLLFSSIGWCSFPSFVLWFFLIFTKKKNILKQKIIYP